MATEVECAATNRRLSYHKIWQIEGAAALPRPCKERVKAVSSRRGVIWSCPPSFTTCCT